MTDAELDRLERLARDALKGPWEVVGCEKFPHRADVRAAWTVQPKYKSGPRKGQPKGEPKHLPVVCGIMLGSCYVEDAEFIAAADPGTVLALVAELRRLRAEVAGLPAR